MTVTGNALRMQLELAALMKRHGYAAEPHFVKLADPVDYPVDVSGLASTVDVDLYRRKFQPYAFGISLKRYSPPLHWKHDESRTVGEVTDLRYDDRGQLRVAARVDDPLARRANAFSVGATILQYEICNADTPNFHALVTSAALVEISLADHPGNPCALVQSRSRAAPVASYLRAVKERAVLTIKAVQLIQQGLASLAKMYREQSPDSRLPSAGKTSTSTELLDCSNNAPGPAVIYGKLPTRPRHAARPQVEPHRASEFGRLVDAIDARNPL